MLWLPFPSSSSAYIKNYEIFFIQFSFFFSCKSSSVIKLSSVCHFTKLIKVNFHDIVMNFIVMISIFIEMEICFFFQHGSNFNFLLNFPPLWDSLLCSKIYLVWCLNDRLKLFQTFFFFLFFCFVHC